MILGNKLANATLEHFVWYSKNCNVFKCKNDVFQAAKWENFKLNFGENSTFKPMEAFSQCHTGLILNEKYRQSIVKKGLNEVFIWIIKE